MAEAKFLEKKLASLLAANGPKVDATTLSRLVEFIILMDKWNHVYNLTSVRNPEDMLLKHIVDSVVVSPYLEGQTFVDVGTGPGLPGIPLAIMNPDKTFYLVDSQSKRINFVREVRRIIGLKNVVPVLSRCEEFKLPEEQKADCVLSRAFASLKDMLTLCSHMVDANGCYLALKGQITEEELADIPTGFMVQENIDLKVPAALGQRCIVKITKKEGH